MNKGSFGNSGSTPLFIEAQTPKPKAKNQNQNSKKQSKTEDRNPQSCNIEAFKFNQKTEERERKEEQGVLKMEEVVLFVDDLHKISYCRICHEAEFESCKELEAPCACSGTAKVKKGGKTPTFLCSGFVFMDSNSEILISGEFEFLIFHCSLLTENAFKDGVMKKETQFVKSVCRSV